MDDNVHRPASLRTAVAQSSIDLEAPHNGLAWPLHVSTTYTRDESYGYPSDYVYGRADNVTVRQTEALIASLEGGAGALLFGSGMAAAGALVQAFDKPVHVVASSDMYYGLRRWFAGIGRFGHSIRFVDTSDLNAVRAAVDLDRPGLVWLETPSNPLWTITDIEAVADIAHGVGATVCVDSTVATPVFTQPISLGADVVLHSATKYLNGHSDVSAGALVTSHPSDLWRRIADMRAEQNASLSAIEAWLLARGLRTLDLRVRAQARSAHLLAARLQSHPAVASVLYPGLASHPGHAIAARQMTGGFGGMLSIRMRGGTPAALAAAQNVRLWKRATSLGGVESLIEHRSSMEGPLSACPGDLIRLSVGIEDTDDLFADLDQALHARADVAPPTLAHVDPTRPDLADWSI